MAVGAGNRPKEKRPHVQMSTFVLLGATKRLKIHAGEVAEWLKAAVC